jgi:YHS domain-containing protein
MRMSRAGILSLAAVMVIGAAASIWAFAISPDAKWPVSALAEDKKEEAAPPQAFDKAPPVGTKAMCPVSKHHFVVSEKTERSEYKGKHYVFCCADCKAPFDAEPEKYLSSKGGGAMPHHE